MSQHDLKALVRQAGDHAEEDLVLATVVATRGSTYRKAGARMLLSKRGPLAGIVGGGCFDADLAEQAKAVMAANQPRITTYDMRSPDDAIWGLGLGCEGAADILLQTPLQSRQTLALIEGMVADQGGWLATGIVRDSDSFGDSRQTPETADAAWFLERVDPPPQLLVCGAGVDAQPLVALALQCGYRVRVVDHRPAAIRPERFPGAEVSLYEGQPFDTVDAAVIMSHNLNMDIAYLKALAVTGTSYLGALGPSERRNLLLNEAGEDVVNYRLKGPAGLDLGGELPEAIALSIMAEIQSHVYRGNGLPWTGQGRK